ncbi:uncharacterized protein LOC131327496 [Rhododendron vialii]|uniref:uncharacterized protein LOC131327496 n=1 Tax=Rhododendron vialii TaxID=182163 RepID=UPI00265DBBEE|nr:uncharacterized protein LOC131327496 [Rhododendron vialii]
MALLKPFFLFIHVVFLLSLHYSGSPLVAGFVQGGNETDRLALLAFKAAVTSDPFGALNSWNESIHFCQWNGVTCGRRHQRVIVLRLEHQELTGSVSPHVGNLSFLRELWLRKNSFSHEISPELGRLRRLRILTMVNNSITGEIPSNISSCSYLAALELSGNKLAGKIPSELGSLTKLERLLIERNNITGGLPSTLGNLSSLTNLTAYNNSITGNIPETLGGCKKLEVLRLGGNKLFGTLPFSIYNLSSMRDLRVSYNQIEGNLPSNPGITLPNLIRLALSNNLFTGYLPISISNATKLHYINLAKNRFEGKVPPLEKLCDLELLVLSENHLGIGEVDDLSFLNSLTNATKFSDLGLGDNNFGGVLPKSISNFSTRLRKLSLYDNYIVGSIPTGIGNLVNLQILGIENNHLSGNIPVDIGKLRKLEYLYLDVNNFYGEIPSCLSNLTSLSELTLSKNNLQSSIPSSLGKCQRMQELNLGHNNLSGIIPKEVISISSLLSLDLSSNNLAGNLPAEVGNLKNLEEFYASENKLSSGIPSTLGSCVKLRLLYLDGNKLWGNLPATLANLRGVEVLNLSNNNFSGQIPKYLDGFIFLNTLDLSFNDFEGAVPERGVFKNASAIFVEGNNKLCGGVAELQLRSCNSIKGRRKGFTIGKLILSVSFGLLGLLVMLGVLYLCWSKKTTKVPSFRIVGNSLPQLSYQSLLRATDGFSLTNLIGVGSFGSVYKGILDQSGKVVAVKVLNLQFRGASKSFIAECKAMKTIKHRNLVGILTICSSIDYQGNDFKALVYEFMVNGSLHEWLHPNGNEDDVHEELRSLNLLQRLHIAIDVASALDYLHHHCWEPIVHCDLKPSNVLLDNKMTARVADFGLARFLLKATNESSANQSSSIGMRGSVGYAPPEYGVGNEVSTSGDVYSYGILLLEMVTGKRPTDSMFTGSLTLHNFAKTALPEPVDNIFDQTLIPQDQMGEASTSISNVRNHSSLSSHKMRECLISLLQVGIACSQEQAIDRPDINKVLTGLHKTKNILLGTVLKYVRVNTTILLDLGGHYLRYLKKKKKVSQYSTLLSVRWFMEQRERILSKLCYGECNMSFGIKKYTQNLGCSSVSDWDFENKLGRLRRLKILTVANNSITGEIPSSISGCSNLVALELSGNKLAGKIPLELGSLIKRERLFIERNNVSGGLPSTLGNLSSLTYLFAHSNSITGNIPDTLGGCKKLEILSLGVNKLVGTFSFSIYNLSSIRELYLPYNQIEGCLPSDLGITLLNLQRLVLAENLFTGYIPISVSNATKLYGLYLGGNSFKGKVPLLEKLRDLERIQLAHNHLGTGEVDDLSFLNSLTNATKLHDLIMGDNNFGGVLPESISNFSTHLSRLGLYNNKIGGSIPTGIGNLINLEGLSISNNHLSGNLPADIGKLQKLQVLSLGGNKFYGEIPSCLANLTSLSQLVLSQNNLQGSIPSSLGKCQLLRVLYLYQNNLSGIIPKELISISSLLALDLSNNNLSGKLPIDIGNFKNLEEFVASKNTLSDRIPSTLSSCLTIISQDKSQSTWMVIFLNTLDLSFNDFEGAIPEKGVFKNATAISVEGNNKLCGGIPKLQLRNCNSKKGRRKGFTIIGKLILSVSFGLLGLLVMLVVLYLCWSRKTTKVPSFRILGNSFPQLSYQSLHRATDGFSLSNLIGVGSFGSIYKGILDQSGKVVAVKVLNLQFHGASKSFIAECKAMKGIKHRNLVRILTACSSIDYQGNDFKALVYEFMVNGSLEEWLHRNGNGDGVHKELRSLNVLQRIHIAIDVASALDYLHHHCWDPIVHCDLKPSNILLDNEMTARLADFGFARFLLKATHESSANQSSSIGMRGSVGYAAPEYGTGNDVSTSGDVYSYGILLLEMVTGKRPTDSMFTGSLTLHNFAKTALPEPVESIIDQTLIPQGQMGEASTSISSVRNQSSLSSHKIHVCLISLLQVGITCSEEQPTDRPDINQVVTDLHNIKNILLGSGIHGGRRSCIAV